MSIIKDSYNPTAVILTNTQKAVLGIAFNSPTPEVAFEQANGTPALITARNILERLGLVNATNNTLVLTPSGQQAVVNNNIADESGAITPEGEALINAVSQSKAVSEDFSLLQSLIESCQ